MIALENLIISEYPLDWKFNDSTIHIPIYFAEKSSTESFNTEAKLPKKNYLNHPIYIIIL